MAKGAGKKATTISDLPPFPELVWDEFFWSASVTLNSWKGFLSCGGDYGAVDSDEPSDGAATVYVLSGDDEDETPPLAEQGVAYQFLLDNDKAVRNEIVKAVFAYYPKVRERYKDDFDADEFAEKMPVIKKPIELVQRMGLSIVHILNIHHDGAAYVGFEFGCDWDEEHGLGVMTHQGRIVVVGQADEAFDEHIAKDDRKAMKKTAK